MLKDPKFPDRQTIGRGIRPYKHHQSGLQSQRVALSQAYPWWTATCKTFTSSNAERRLGAQSRTLVTQSNACSHYCTQANTTTAWEPTQSISGGATFHNWLRVWMGLPVRHAFFYLHFMDTYSHTQLHLWGPIMSFIPTAHSSHTHTHQFRTFIYTMCIAYISTCNLWLD